MCQQSSRHELCWLYHEWFNTFTWFKRVRPLRIDCGHCSLSSTFQLQLDFAMISQTTGCKKQKIKTWHRRLPAEGFQIPPYQPAVQVTLCRLRFGSNLRIHENCRIAYWIGKTTRIYFSNWAWSCHYGKSCQSSGNSWPHHCAPVIAILPTRGYLLISSTAATGRRLQIIEN